MPVYPGLGACEACGLTDVAECPSCSPDPTSVSSTDCRTSEGVAMGLIDGMIAMARVLHRDYSDKLDAGALADLRNDEDLAWLLRINR